MISAYHSNLGAFSLPDGVTPGMLMTAAGAMTSASVAVSDLTKAITNFKLRTESDINVRLPSSGEMLGRALPPALLATAFIAGTAFLVGAAFRAGAKHKWRKVEQRSAIDLIPNGTPMLTQRSRR
jgi:hypothetical protein